MIRRSFFFATILLPCIAYGADPSANLSTNVAPPGSSPPAPAAAAAAGFTTLALNSDFSQRQPAGWFGCLGSGPGHTWYAARDGGDNSSPTVPCPDRFNLVNDPTIGKQVFDLTFQSSDILSNRHYVSAQTADDSAGPPGCCVHGVVFPSNYYMEATVRMYTTPYAPKMNIGGVQMAFWNVGEGVAPAGSRWNTLEVDHPEIRGEKPTLLGWAAIDWYQHTAGGYFPYNDVTSAPGWDVTQYHTYGVRSTTDGTTFAVCSYVDGVQRPGGCLSVTADNALYTERKFPILFIGMNCYDPAYGVEANCINIPISSIYNCGGTFCVHASSPVWVANYWPSQMNISGVTGASNINQSWLATPISWSNGSATDWTLTGSSFNGSPSGGTINQMSAVDLLVQDVHVWSCANWQTSNCNTPVLAGTP